MTIHGRRCLVLGLTHLGFTLQRIADELGYAKSTIIADRAWLFRQHGVRSVRQLLIATW